MKHYFLILCIIIFQEKNVKKKLQEAFNYERRVKTSFRFKILILDGNTLNAFKLIVPKP